MAEGEIPPQATNGSRSHSSLPSLKAGLFISLSVIFMIIPSFISLTSQILTPLVEVMKTDHGLRLVLLVVFVTVCVFVTSNINRNENASSYDNNDDHEWISCIFSSYPDDDDLLYHYYQQREDQVQEERRESNLQPKTPPSLPPLRPPVFNSAKENKEHIQKSVHTNLINPQKPSSTAAQKPPLPDEEVMRSNRVDQHVGSGTASPSPQAGARRKPLSPLKRSSWSSSEDEKASSSSNSPSFSPFLQPPPPPPFQIRPQKHTLYARIQSDNSSSCDSPHPMSSSPDINVKSEHFIRKVKADLEDQRRGRSNLAGPRSSKTRLKKEELV